MPTARGRRALSVRGEYVYVSIHVKKYISSLTLDELWTHFADGFWYLWGKKGRKVTLRSEEEEAVEVEKCIMEQ
uniref:Uncharacterized protein n=1 Tax=Physcomitrium patens TaxID=3218 RepID=A0A2K1IB68_PHYPA|nr:hypothetical protein PHYPA_031090 [Physcomitrium patens]